MTILPSADGNYEVTLMTKATLHFNGKGIYFNQSKKNVKLNV